LQSRGHHFHDSASNRFETWKGHQPGPKIGHEGIEPPICAPRFGDLLEECLYGLRFSLHRAQHVKANDVSGMKADFARRLDLVSSRVAALQQTAEPHGGGPSLWKLLLLMIAVYEGEYGSHDSVMTALARALKFDSMRDFNAAFEEPGRAEFNRRYGAAMRRLLARGRLDPNTMTAEQFGRFVETAILGVPPELLQRVGLAEMVDG
jgi:hypothetical protein